ncbi:uncharacterized protein V1510DRAFT_419019 [Dipodascopsis tothii]|uniref:uncharacterized protein n=1 Tax=Dipodascopsis tothii TaxID=44089 RepID=UPI0034CEEF2B
MNTSQEQSIAQPATAGNGHRSKRILISTYDFPRHPAPLSRRSPLDTRFTKSASEIPETPARPQIEKDIQRSLLQIGMKVRKNVSDGYKLPPKSGAAAVVGVTAGRPLVVDPFAPEPTADADRAALKRGREVDVDSDTETVIDDSMSLDSLDDFEEASFLVPRSAVDEDARN